MNQFTSGCSPRDTTLVERYWTDEGGTFALIEVTTTVVANCGGSSSVIRNLTTGDTLTSKPREATQQPQPTFLVTPVGGSGSAVTDAQIGARFGAQSDAPADGSGAGSYSLFAAVKRGLLNWAALLSRMPELSDGRIPVAAYTGNQLGSGAVTATTQRVVHATIPATAGSSTVTLPAGGTFTVPAGARSLSVMVLSGSVMCPQARAVVGASATVLSMTGIASLDFSDVSIGGTLPAMVFTAGATGATFVYIETT